MAVHKLIVECNAIIENGLRTWDLPLLDGCDYSLLEDKGDRMVVKITACDNPDCVNKPIILSKWNIYKAQLIKSPSIELSIHPKDLERKHSYGKPDRDASGNIKKDIFGKTVFIVGEEA